MLNKRELLYSGKVKNLYATEDLDLVIMEHRNDATAFNAKKKANLEKKGEINNRFNAHIMTILEKAGIATHFVKLISNTECLVKKLDMIPVEFVIRNRVAGGLSQRLGLEEGIVLRKPLLELFFKSDRLGDPMINENHVEIFEWARPEEMVVLKSICYQINEILKVQFEKVRLLLVDFKLEFGRFKNQLLLGDEFTLDGCRLWDSETYEKFDKDRFRRDLGEVIEHYESAAARLGVNNPA